VTAWSPPAQRAAPDPHLPHLHASRSCSLILIHCHASSRAAALARRGLLTGCAPRTPPFPTRRATAIHPHRPHCTLSRPALRALAGCSLAHSFACGLCAQGAPAAWSKSKKAKWTFAGVSGLPRAPTVQPVPRAHRLAATVACRARCLLQGLCKA